MHGRTPVLIYTYKADVSAKAGYSQVWCSFTVNRIGFPVVNAYFTGIGPYGGNRTFGAIADNGAMPPLDDFRKNSEISENRHDQCAGFT